MRFYFALGTFTTAGTGEISPVSQSAESLQALQMGIDFVLVGFVVVLVMTRYTSRLDRPKPAPAKRATPRASPLKDVPPVAPPAWWLDPT